MNLLGIHWCSLFYIMTLNCTIQLYSRMILFLAHLLLLQYLYGKLSSGIKELYLCYIPFVFSFHLFFTDICWLSYCFSSSVCQLLHPMDILLHCPCFIQENFWRVCFLSQILTVCQRRWVAIKKLTRLLGHTVRWFLCLDLKFSVLLQKSFFYFGVFCIKPIHYLHRPGISN